MTTNALLDNLDGALAVAARLEVGPPGPGGGGPVTQLHQEGPEGGKEAKLKFKASNKVASRRHYPLQSSFLFTLNLYFP